MKICSIVRFDVTGVGGGGAAAGGGVGGGGAFTAMLTAADVAVPPGPVAVAVKLVVAVGLTCRVPVVAGCTAPMPG